MSDYSEFTIGWNCPDDDHPDGQVAVGSWPDTPGSRTDRLTFTGGYPFFAFQEWKPETLAQVLLNLAAHMMFCGISPARILEEFAHVSLWRDMGFLLPQGQVQRAFIPGRIDWNPHNP